ncbi:hypothetical protein J2Y86_005638 [Pseudomonas migulae]|uniref:hypothetical protein n=1 Tax=Pseudomonas migulae TaxID=78543 RepID=UPI00209EC532|nr:hypothetical protein [Pseudomonas migulae]MCP1500931.1 hypothetical protein [Pseudomonas migulae]
MTSIAPNKVINTAVSAPGAGKTQAFITQIPSLLSARHSIVLALPTLDLSDSFVRRLPAGVPYRVINSTTCDHVGTELMAALKKKESHLIITTHQSIFAVRPNLLRSWTLVVDELPPVVDFPAFPFEPSELAQLFVNAMEHDGRLYIREGCAGAIETSLATFKAVSAGAERTSMLSKEGARIYECLKDGHPVFIDSEIPNGNRYVRAVVESSCWDTFAAAEEVHVLAASVIGSQFDDFAQVHGVTYARSDFTPAFEGYTSAVTIYPVMPKGRNYSKSAVTMIAHGGGATDQPKQGELLVIDDILKAALQRTTGTPLLFSNNWAGLRWLPRGTVHRCSIDSRGLNEYQGETDAILLFGGNPSPSDQLALEFLATKYGREFRQGFIVTRFLEPSLQAATRTAVRDRRNTKPIQLFVQDGRVADYLIATYMPHAVIDWSLSEICPVGEDRRTTVDVRRVQVCELFAQGKKNAEIARLTGVHRNTLPSWREDWRAGQAA